MRSNGGGDGASAETSGLGNSGGGLEMVLPLGGNKILEPSESKFVHDELIILMMIQIISSQLSQGINLSVKVPASSFHSVNILKITHNSPSSSLVGLSILSKNLKAASSFDVAFIISANLEIVSKTLRNGASCLKLYMEEPSTKRSSINLHVILDIVCAA